MEFKQITLDNGLQVCAEVNPQAFSQSLGYFVKTGSRDEKPEMAGVSHFLEHMVFKGTSSRSAEDVNRELDELGSQSNAYTSEDQTVFYLSIIPEFQEHATELLSDLMRPALRDADFETERQVILEEIAMYDDSPPYGAMERCMEEFFGSHPLSTRVLGTPHTVSQLDTDLMRGYHQQRYAPDNLCFTAAGNVDFEALVKQLDKLTKSWRPGSFVRQKPKPSFKTSNLELRHPPAVQQYTFQMSPGVDRFDVNRHAWRLMATIIGDDSGSRMFWALTDPGLAESAGMFAQEYDECGIVGLYLTCTPEDTQSNWELMQEVLQTALTEPVTERELEIAKNKIFSGSILASERPGNRLFTVGNAVSLRGTYESLEQALENYRRVNVDVVNAALVEYLQRPAVRVTVGPELSVLTT
jgi:predicted Zn-dependent peptidase